MTDAELIRDAQLGDRGAVQTLYERYLPTVWRYVYAHAHGPKAMVEDVVSETFLALVRQLQTIKPEGGALAGWLIGVARHKLQDVHRRDRAQFTGMDLNSVDGGQPADTSFEQRELVVHAIERLDDVDRLVLEWKYIEGLTVREIANRMGRTEKAVESLLLRARRSFRELVELQGGPEPCHPTN